MDQKKAHELKDRIVAPNNTAAGYTLDGSKRCAEKAASKCLKAVVPNKELTCNFCKKQFQNPSVHTQHFEKVRLDTRQFRVWKSDGGPYQCRICPK